MVTTREVVCQSSAPVSQGNRGFPQAPIDADGIHWFLAVVDANGTFKWGNGNIPGADTDNDHVLEYQQPYNAAGWTIASTPEGTTFTNDGTGHGMFVSIENVSAF